MDETVTASLEWEAPPDIEAPWRGMWIAAVAELRRIGVWRETLRPLLDCYVIAMQTAADHRRRAEAKPVQTNKESGLSHMHAGFTSADRELRRAMLIASEIGLTPKAQRALLAAAVAPETPANPFDALDELAPRRMAKSG